MFRIASFCLLAVVLFPGISAAQYQPYPPSVVPPNPLYYSHPAYRYQLRFGVSVPTAYGPAFVGQTVPLTRAPQLYIPLNPSTNPIYPWAGGTVPSSGYVTGGYLTGGSGRYDSYSAMSDFEKAQRYATRYWASPDAANYMISQQWAYEKLGYTPTGAGAGAGKPPADTLINALNVSSEADVASGAALNQILAAIATAESRGGKGASAFLAPQVLEEVRFAGATGDALNLLRQSGRLPYPAVFSTPELSDFRDAIDREFTAMAAPALAGKAIDPAKLMKFESTLKKVETVAPAIIRDLSFEEAIATRRFLNQFANTVRSLKAGGVTGLVNPAWATEGTKTADLANHMAKFKLQFAAAADGTEPSYLALHRSLSTYLFALTESAPPKK